MTKGSFVAVGEVGIRASSTDGRNWLTAESPAKAAKNKKGWGSGGAFWGLATGEGRAVAVGPFGNAGFLHSSFTEGSGWTDVELLEEKGDKCRLLDVAFGDGRFVAVGGETPNYISGYWRWSDDGLKWSEPHVMTRRDFHGAGGMLRVCYGNDRFLAIGKTGKLGTSSDGESWDFRDIKKLKIEPLTDTFIEVCHGNGLFVGTGLHGLRRCSEDGTTWSEPEFGKEGEHLNTMIWTGSQFVGVGPGGTYFSPDGRTWQRQSNRNAPLFIAYGNGVYAGVRYRGEVLVSQDAIEWEVVGKLEEDLRAIDFLPAAT